LVLLAALALLASPAQADEFDRDGRYLGLNYAHGFNFIQEAIDRISGDKIDSDDTSGLNVRGGYRFLSWLSLETTYEFMGDFRTQSALGSTTIESHTLMLGPKFLIPTWRIQPYLLLGFGGQVAELDFTGKLGLLGERETSSEWNLAARPALGIDFYITKHVVANLELAGVLVAGKFENIGTSFSDPIYLSVGGGLQYRF